MKKLFFILSLIWFGLNAFSQVVPVGVVNAIGDGDAGKFAGYFHNNVEIRILGEDHVASKNQATRIMHEFFKNNPPVSFSINYEGNKNDSKYGFGTLVTKKGTYRINLYFMKGRKNPVIYSISIEKT